MATQPHILSFDEAKRDTRARRRAVVAPEDRPVIHSIDVPPAFESPFRQPGQGGGRRAASGAPRAASASRARSGAASRSASLGSLDGTRVATARPASPERPAGRHAAPPRSSSRARSASDPYGAGRLAAFDERVDEAADERGEEAPLSRREQRKKSRAKSKAERKFNKQFGGSKRDVEAAQAQAGPRAALYKGEMGAKQRQAARMQHASNPNASAKRRFSLGSLLSFKSSPKFIASAAVVVCLVLSGAFLYPTAQQCYQAMRERDQLAAEYAALSERNDALAGDVASLQTAAGIEDRAHEQFGWVKEGEETANVRGLELDDDGSSAFRANITPGSVEAPETWYSPFLDTLFGVE